MQGGKRVNAGRKSVSLKEKKVGFKVYLTPELHEEINYYGIGASFSEKCANLIAKRIQEEKESFDSTIYILPYTLICNKSFLTISLDFLLHLSYPVCYFFCFLII